MINLFRIYCFHLIGILIISQTNIPQIENSKDPINLKTAPIISGVHTLSVHVRDTLTHDSVYQFFLRKLKLPIYYTPVKFGKTRYAGIYAGNMVLEPCGPYKNTIYAANNFRAIFYGMNFEVYQSLTICEHELNIRGISHQVNQGSIYIKDSILCNENVFSALYEVNDKLIRDSLQNVLITSVKNKPGIEYIKEIFIGYKEEANLMKWKDYLYPMEFGRNDVCQINDSLQIHFKRGNINEVRGITFKVKSLEKAKEYLARNKFLITGSDKRIKLNQTQSFGLSIYFTDEK